MGLDYIDMMLIHSPQPWKEVNQSENRCLLAKREVWKALEDAYDEGKVEDNRRRQLPRRRPDEHP